MSFPPQLGTVTFEYPVIAKQHGIFLVKYTVPIGNNNKNTPGHIANSSENGIFQPHPLHYYIRIRRIFMIPSGIFNFMNIDLLII